MLNIKCTVLWGVHFFTALQKLVLDCLLFTHRICTNNSDFHKHCCCVAKVGFVTLRFIKQLMYSKMIFQCAPSLTDLCLGYVEVQRQRTVFLLIDFVVNELQLGNSCLCYLNHVIISGVDKNPSVRGPASK